MVPVPAAMTLGVFSMSSPIERDAHPSAVDVVAIGALKARYCRYIDLKRWQSLEALFTPDCTFTLDSMDKSEMGNSAQASLTREAFVSMVSEVLVAGSTSVHHVHSPELTSHNRTEASGIWAMEDYVVSPARSFRGYGHYIETYRKSAGVWRIARWRLDRLRIDTLQT